MPFSTPFLTPSPPGQHPLDTVLTALPGAELIFMEWFLESMVQLEQRTELRCTTLGLTLARRASSHSECPVHAGTTQVLVCVRVCVCVCVVCVCTVYVCVCVVCVYSICVCVQYMCACSVCVCVYSICVCVPQCGLGAYARQQERNEKLIRLRLLSLLND